MRLLGGQHEKLLEGSIIRTFSLRHIAVCALIATTVACAEDTGLTPQSSGFTDPTAALMSYTTSLSDNPLSMTVARAVPSFAGLYFDAAGDLVVATTDGQRSLVAEGIVRKGLGNHYTSRGFVTRNTARFVTRSATHTFLDLVRYKAQIQAYLGATSGVVSYDVKESENRVKVGVTDDFAAREVRESATRIGIPSSAVEIWIAPDVSDAAHDLSGSMGAIHGGWEITSPSDLCTLGFSARRDVDWSPVFVTASHCTPSSPGWDGAPIAQAGVQIGNELHDPPAQNINGAQYRASDATLISAITGIQFGTIARTTSSSGCESCSNPTTILHSNPTISITGRRNFVIENERLHKVGRATGWTFGNVEDSCSDFFSNGWWKWCSDRVDFSLSGGDSGSPVFAMKADGTAELRGIAFATIGFPYNDAIMSNLGQIEADLGQLVVYDPGPPTVVIAGPTVVPAGAVCTWSAEYSGLAPYSDQQWSGVLSGTTWSIQGTLSASGYLQFAVRDRLGRLGYSTLYIEVQGGGQGEFCPEA